MGTTSSLEGYQCSCTRKPSSADDAEDAPEIETSYTVEPDTSTTEPASPRDLAGCDDLGGELLAATKEGDTGRVRLLLSQKASANSKEKKSGHSPLHIAASEGRLALVPLLLSKRASPNRKDEDGNTPLFLAAENEYGELAALLAEVLKPKERDGLGKRLLDTAARFRVEEARILLCCRAQADARNKDGRSGLHIAAKWGHASLAQLLLDAGAKRDAKSKAGRTPLAEAARKGHVKMISWLVNRGARVKNTEQIALGEGLLKAAEAGKIELVKTLLSYDAPADAKRKDGLTALVLAAENGQMQLCTLLSRPGISPLRGPAAERMGEMLMEASGKGDLARVRDLAMLGASVNARDVLYETPLLKAAFHDHVEVVDFLCRQKAELEMRSMNYNRTALLLAIDKGAAATMDLLLARKAELPDPSILGWRLRDAGHHGDTSKLQMLLRIRANVHAAQEDSPFAPGGDTALHKAVAAGHVEAARILLTSSSDVDAKAGKPGQTALFTAAANGSLELVNLLIASRANHRGKDKEGFKNAQKLLKLGN